jgi:uncharacterized protein Smg (DUF494 family)
VTFLISQTVDLKTTRMDKSHVVRRKLKVWLARYLDRLGQKTGYMVFLEKKSALELSWEDRIRREVLIVDNKEIILYAM